LIPDFEQPWEQDYGRPGRITSALDIMLDGPIGGAAFNNEFGRPNVCGYFRSFEMTAGDQRRGGGRQCGGALLSRSRIARLRLSARTDSSINGC